MRFYMDMAEEGLSRDYFGAMYDMAVATKAAFLFTLFNAGAGGAGGLEKIGGGAPVASVSEGGVSVSFAQGGTDSSGLESNRFGKMHLAIIKGRPRMGVNTAGGRG